MSSLLIVQGDTQDVPLVAIRRALPAEWTADEWRPASQGTPTSSADVYVLYHSLGSPEARDIWWRRLQAADPQLEGKLVLTFSGGRTEVAITEDWGRPLVCCPRSRLLDVLPELCIQLPKTHEEILAALNGGPEERALQVLTALMVVSWAAEAQGTDGPAMHAALCAPSAGGGFGAFEDHLLGYCRALACAPSEADEKWRAMAEDLSCGYAVSSLDRKLGEAGPLRARIEAMVAAATSENNGGFQVWNQHLLALRNDLLCPQEAPEATA